MFNIRFVAYSSDGTRLGAIPTPLSFQMCMPLLGIPTLQITWTDKIPAYFRMDDLPVLAAEWSNGGQWTEFLDGRFYPLKHNWDRLDDTGAHSCDYRGLIGALEETLVWSGANTDEGRRRFENKTPSQIFTPMFNEARTRGSAHFLLALRNEITGTQTACTREYELSNTLFSVLQDLTSAGEFEYRVDGTALVLVNRVGSDLTANRFNPTWVRDILSTSSPEEHNYSDLCNVVKLVSDGGKSWTAQDNESIAIFGRREKVLSQAGVTNATDANQIMQAFLAANKDFSKSYSREYPVDGTNRPLPGRDFNPGDAAYVDTVYGHKVRLRISEISYKQDSAGTLTAYVTFGDLSQSVLAKLATTQSSLSAGATVSSLGGGTPSPTPPPTPAAPLNLRATTRGVINSDGTNTGEATLTWDPVGTSTDGRTLYVSRYRCGWKLALAGANWHLAEETTTTSCSFTDLPVGENILFCVAAISTRGVVGEYSTTAQITIGADTTPPPTPSTPTVTSRLGGISVTWDGLDAGGQAMPADFDHINIYVDGSIAGTLDRIINRWFSDQLILDRTYQVSISAVDRTGNESTRTTPVSVTVVGAVSETDIQDALTTLETQIVSAQTAAAGKGTVFYNSDQTPPAALSLADIWFTTSGQIMKPTAVGSTVWTPITLDDMALRGLDTTKLVGQIASTQITDHAITTNKIAANAITADSGIIANAAITNAMIANLDAGKVTTGTLDAQRIGAHSITVEHLAVTGGNLFPDSSVADHSGWRRAQTDAIVPVVEFTGDTSNIIYYRPSPTVGDLPLILDPGTYRLGVSFTATKVAGSSLTLTSRRFVALEDGTQGTGDIGSTPVEASGSQWWYTVFSISARYGALAYAGKASIGFRVAATGTAEEKITIDKISLQRVADANLIVDGAVTAGKIAANAVTSNTIEAGAITSAKIAANAITADKLQAEAATIEKLWANGISAKVIDATSISVSGANLIPTYNWSSGDNTGWSQFTLDAATSSIAVSGRATKMSEAKVGLEAGVEYVFSCDALSSIAGTRYFVQFVNTVNAQGTGYPANGVTIQAEDTWETYTATFVPTQTCTAYVRIHANHDSGTPNPSGYQKFRKLSLRAKTGSVLIENGAVTADKLATGALNFKTAQGMSLSAGSIIGSNISTSSTHPRITMDSSTTRLFSTDEEGYTRWELIYSGLKMWKGGRELGFLSPRGHPDKESVQGIGLTLNYTGDFIAFGYLPSPDSHRATYSFLFDPQARFMSVPGIRILEPIVCGEARNSSNVPTQTVKFTLAKNPKNGWEYAVLKNSAGGSGLAFGASGLWLIHNNSWYPLDALLK